MVPIICRSHRACLKGVLEAVTGGMKRRWPVSSEALRSL